MRHNVTKRPITRVVRKAKISQARRLEGSKIEKAKEDGARNATERRVARRIEASCWSWSR